MKTLVGFALTIGTATALLAGCGGSQSSSGSLPQLVPAATVVGDVTIAGTYDGSFKESLGGKSRSGSCEITLSQSGKSVKGTADVQFDSGKSYDYTIAGTIKSSGKKGAKLSLTVTDDKGSSGKGSATIKGKKMRGKGSISGEDGVAYITFTATRKKK
jgi:hypothetical protein